MYFRAQATRYLISGLPVLAAATLFSATSHAASNGAFPCEQVKRDLRSLDVPVGALAAVKVDHAPIVPETNEGAPVVNESVAPVLHLGPRVTSILRDIFDVNGDEMMQEAAPKPSTSPLADSDRKSEVAEPANAAPDKNELPRFQRHMLRTDI